MEKSLENQNDHLDTSKMCLQTFQLMPQKDQTLSHCSNPRKSARLSASSTIRIYMEEDRSSLELSKRYRHSQPLQILQNTQRNISQVMNNTRVSCKHVLKSDYERYIDEYSRSKLKFTDPEFLPIQRSIGESMPEYNWKRISQIIQQPKFVKDFLSASDVLQGEIGDCYFLSAIAALAQNDYRIKNIFPSLEIQPTGIYMARILHQGILRQVVVDDFVPVNDKSIPVFAKPTAGKQIWVIILQKCWAKLYGSYQAIVGGLPHEVLHAFSGAPTIYKSIPAIESDQNQLFQQLNLSYENGDILCCGTKPNLRTENKGLVKGHAYTILGVYKNPVRLLKLRNPWGQLQWTGRASHKDKTFWAMMTQDFKERIGYTQHIQSLSVPDGIFFMLWEDFVQLFDMVDICRIRDNASYFCFPTNFNYKNGCFFEFSLMQQADITLAISQKSLRGSTNIQMKKGYSKTTIILAKCTQVSNSKQYKFIKSNQCISFPDHYLDAQRLKEGHYVFFVKADWIDKGTQRGVISVYTEAKINLRRVEKQVHKDFLFKVFVNHAKRNLNRRMVVSEEPLEWICSDFLANHGSYGYSVYHIDRNSKARFVIEFDQQDFKKQNLVLKKPYKRNGRIKTLVKPGQNLIILFRLMPYHYTEKITIPIPKVYRF